MYGAHSSEVAQESRWSRVQIPPAAPNSLLGDNLKILKIGGSVIGDKNKAFDFREDVIREIARQIKEVGGQWVLIHGGGPFGHPLVKMLGVKPSIAVSMIELSVRIARIMNEEELNVVPLPSYGEYKESVRRLVEKGWIPLLQGNVTPDRTIISGDDIALELSKYLKPEYVLFATDVDGIYETWPPRGRPLKVVEACKFNASRSEGFDVTGGMQKKLETISLMPKDTKVIVFNGLKRGAIINALKGLEGTRVIPCGE